MAHHDTQNQKATSAAAYETALEAGVSENTNRTWYRTVFFQATVIGLCAFFAPGLYNAMQSTGAGGQQTPYLVMSANAVLGVMMVVTCSMGSVVANRIGLKNALIFGTTGYAIYSASLYTNNRYGTEWFVYVGSAACGITAGVFWAAEGAIMISYPEDHKRGRYLAYWLAYRNGGSIVGGAINLAFTKILVRKDFLLVFPFFFYATFLLSYAGSYLSLYFSVRSRALASLVSALAQITANFFFGHFLDWTRFSINQRARIAYVGMMALFGGTWVWATIIQHEYGLKSPALDWVDTGFGRGWALYILLQVNFALAYNFGYWLAGYMARDTAEVIRFTSTVRAVEAAGGAVASGISSTHAPLIAAVGVNFGLWGLALVPTYFVVRTIGVNFPNADSEGDSGKNVSV
ncbi:DUF895 domain-containing membrane protein [Colletotrichum incanum]|nr:DUF895 domain-containing membrane protein [Colletotrichum incanum]